MDWKKVAAILVRDAARAADRAVACQQAGSTQAMHTYSGAALVLATLADAIATGMPEERDGKDDM